MAAIAEIELPRGQWHDLVHILFDNVTTTDDANLKQATLKTIGYICEGVVSCLPVFDATYPRYFLSFRTLLYWLACQTNSLLQLSKALVRKNKSKSISHSADYTD